MLAVRTCNGSELARVVQHEVFLQLRFKGSGVESLFLLQ
jgi:hypothetical protein